MAKIITEWTAAEVTNKDGSPKLSASGKAINSGLMYRVYEDDSGKRRVQLDYCVSLKVDATENSVLHTTREFMQLKGTNSWLKIMAGTRVQKAKKERIAPPPPSTSADDFPSA